MTRLSRWPLSRWPLSRWPLSRWPLSRWPLSRWPLSRWPLSRWPLSLWPVVFLLGAWSSCDNNILGDAGFDLWCGDTLCDWEVEEGSVEPVPTWHAEDEGAKLVGDPSVISQVVYINHTEVNCMQFELMASVDDDAALTLELDFLDNGSVEYEHPIVSDNYQVVDYEITPPTWFDKVRFRVRKTGEGRAVLATLRVVGLAAERCLDQPLVPNDLPVGADCDHAAQCQSGTCSEVPTLSSWEGLPESMLTCGECEIDADCAEGELCGLSFEYAPSGFRSCITPPERSLGQACAVDAECGSGICCADQCSECCDEGEDAACADGGACERRPPSYEETPERFMPHECVEQRGLRGSGEACLFNDDCASNLCRVDPVFGLCDHSGRPCTNAIDCYVEGFTDEDCIYDGDCEEPVCVLVGPANGTCE